MAETKLWIWDEPAFQGRMNGPIVDSDKNLFAFGLGWNDDIESLNIEGDPDGKVIFYRDDSWQGPSWTLGPGWYDTWDLAVLGVPTNEISSFQIIS